MKSKSHPLVVSLDAIINSEEINTETKKELQGYRDRLVDALEADRKKDAVRIALQVASWVKFFFDMLQ